jgi:hypothetical protein
MADDETITDPSLIDIYEMYESLLGVEFTGIYQGNWAMKQDGCTMILSVVSLAADPYGISHVLNNIVTTLDHAPHRIWASLTGPDHSNMQGDYRLWSTSTLDNIKPRQKQSFKITKVTCFKGSITTNNQSFNGGVGLYIETCNDK